MKRVLSLLLFSLLLFGAIYKCADVLEYKEARQKYTPFYESNTNFDVVFLGTSHVWNHVLPMELWHDYGISSYNWGYSNCTPAENYYLLQDILKYTKPKLIVMDVHGISEYEGRANGKHEADRIEQQHVQFDSLPIWSINKFHAAKDVWDDYEHNDDFVWNFIMYHNRWNELGEDDFNYEYTTEKGACFLSGLGTSSYNKIPGDEKTEIDTVCYEYYLMILDYCQENNIQVLCAYLPFAASGGQQRIANTMGDIVANYDNCSYVNMLNENILNFNTDICPDNGHLNYSGASKVTSWLGDYLIENYKLDDFRNNKDWKNDYVEYYRYKRESLLSQDKLVSYLVQLEDDDFEAEAYLYDEDLSHNERLNELFDNANIKP